MRGPSRAVSVTALAMLAGLTRVLLPGSFGGGTHVWFISLAYS